VIADLIRKMTAGDDEVVLWGDGSPTREFLYVEDCVDGLVLAAERYDGPEPINLGADKEISIRELAELVADVVDFRGKITWDTSMPNGQPRRSVDARRARDLFGFEARTPLREGLERTVAWYRKNVLAPA
jgi:GDP-L-fucose synthase